MTHATNDEARSSAGQGAAAGAAEAGHGAAGSTAAMGGATGRLTPTERRLIEYLHKHHGQISCSKARLAAELGRNVKTVDRNVAALRHRGLLEVEPVWAENGGQLANTYRLL